MSGLLEQLAKEHGRVYEEDELHPREPLHIIFFSYRQLEAFAKAYQAAAPIDNVAEALETIVKGIDKLATTIEGEVNYANTDSTNQLMKIIAIQLRALIPDTQANKEGGGL
jgi:hypothetical protein